jgi:hypothetical protein
MDCRVKPGNDELESRKPIVSTSVVARHRVGAYAPPDDRLQRAIQYSRDGSALLRSRSVLDAPPALGMMGGG